jgi:hypothetical protein
MDDEHHRLRTQTLVLVHVTQERLNIVNKVFF